MSQCKLGRRVSYNPTLIQILQSTTTITMAQRQAVVTWLEAHRMAARVVVPGVSHASVDVGLLGILLTGVCSEKRNRALTTPYDNLPTHSGQSSTHGC
jgi:hypothetical protein